MGIEKSWNSDVGIATLNPQPVFPELYHELWWYSGSVASASTSAYMQKGSTGCTSSVISIYTHNANWNQNVKFVLEASLYINSSSYGANIHLYDITSSLAVSGSGITTSSTTATVLRSSQFTLTPGHTYAIVLQSMQAPSGTAYATDVSLIIFPQAPLTSPSVSSISLANASGNTLKEAYIPLWVYSSGTATTTSSNYNFLQKGSTSLSTSTTSSANSTFTMGSQWNPTQQFALEASIYTSNATYSATVRLYDMTAVAPTSATVSTTSTSSTLLRTGSFTLTQGHQYGVALYIGGGYTAYLSKAHLVALAP